MLKSVVRDGKRKVKKPRATVIRRNPNDLGEPEITEPITDPADARLARSLNFYNYVDIRDRDNVVRGWVLEYARAAGYSADEVLAIEKMKQWRIINSIYAMSRMVNRGVEFSPEILAKHDERLRDIITRHQMETAEVVKKPQADVAPVLARYRESVSELVAEMEELVDTVFYKGGDLPDSIYDVLTRKTASLTAATAVVETYRPQLEELEEAASKRGDRDLVEAYRSLGKNELNRRMSILRKIIDGALAYVGGKKAQAVRRPRKKKEVPVEKLVKGVRYLASSKEHQLVSVPPEKVIGAGVAWLFNVKYKTLRRLAAATGEKLSIKGSTVHGFDEKASAQKTLRKPSDFIPHVLVGTSMSSKKMFDTLKTKASIPNGRINEETIILKVQ